MTALTSPAKRRWLSIGRSWTPSLPPSARRETQVRTRSIQRYEATLRILRANPTAKAKEELGEALASCGSFWSIDRPAA